MYECVGPDDWLESSLFGLARWRNGLAFKDIVFSEVGRPVIKIGELKNGVTSLTGRTKSDFDPSVLVTQGDMLFSWSGNPDTSLDVFLWEGEDGWLNQHIFKVTPEEGVSRDFLFFLLRWLRPRFAEIARNKQTTGLGHVTVEDLRRMKVAVPDVREQTAIVEFIGPIQEKIDLNRQMNAVLEALVKDVFRDWFVDFNPTRAKMEGVTPYLKPGIWTLFPDRFDDKGVPSGWSTRTLGEIAKQCGEPVHPDALDPATPYIGLKHMPRRSIALSEWSRADEVNSGKRSFRRSDFLFGKLAPHYHKVGVAPVDGICSTDIVVLNSRERHGASFVISCISQDEFVAYTDLTSSGTTMPRTSWRQMEQFKICVPCEPILQVFDEVVQPILDRIIDNVHESRSLCATRDLLLPKLMSGEIRVIDGENNAKEVK